MTVRKYPGIRLGESVAIHPVIEKQNHTVKNFGTVGYVLPRSEFLRGMADAVPAGDEDDTYLEPSSECDDSITMSAPRPE